jgi:hypothetical protein
MISRNGVLNGEADEEIRLLLIISIIKRNPPVI